MNLVRFSLFAAASALLGGAACAAIAGIELPQGSGVDLGGGLSVLQSSLEFQSTCSSATEKALTIENNGDVESTFAITVPPDAPLAVGDDASNPREVRGTVPPKQRINVKVRVTELKVEKRTGSIVVRVGDNPDKAIPFTVDVRGIELSVFPTRIDFGEVRQQTPATPQTIELRNEGTDEVEVLRFEGPDAGADFTITGLPQKIPGGGSVTLTATLVTGAASPPLSTTFEAKANAVLCNATPPVVTLTGIRVNKDVTVAPTAVEFGEIDCNAKNIAEKAITITNYANEPVAFKVTPLSAGARFSVSPTEGTLAAPQGDAGTASTTQQLKIKLADMNDTTAESLREYVENVTIGLTGPENKDVVVPVKVTSVGAVLTLTPLNVDFNGNGTKSVTITNTGNKFVYVRGAFSGSGASAFSAVNNVPVEKASSSSLDVRFQAPANDVPFAAEVTVVRTSTPFFPFYPPNMQVCNAPVPAVSLSGFRKSNN